MELPQFAVCCWSVGKKNVVGRIKLDGFCVQLDSSPEIPTVYGFRALSDLLQVQGLVGASWSTRGWLTVWWRRSGLPRTCDGYMVGVHLGGIDIVVRRAVCDGRGRFSWGRWPFPSGWWRSSYGVWAMEWLGWRTVSRCLITSL